MALFDGFIEKLREGLQFITEVIPDAVWDVLSNLTASDSIAAALFDWVNRQPMSAGAKERLNLMFSVMPMPTNITTPAAAADFLAQVQAGAAARGIGTASGTAVQRKIFAELARLSEAVARGKVRGGGGAKALTIMTLIMGTTMMMWNVPEAIFGWGTRSINNILDLLGVDKKYRVPQPPGDFTPPGFGQPAFTSLWTDMQTRGLSGLSHPITKELLSPTAENLGEVMTTIAVNRAAVGQTTFPNELIGALTPYLIFAPGAAGLTGQVAGVSAKEVEITPPRVTIRAQKRPKLFVGTIFGGSLKAPQEFERTPDDPITNNEELISDAKENLTRWLNALPNKLTYEVQLKNNPFDENNVQKAGAWVALALYVNNRFGKRIFIDEVLLGPVNPVSYLPELGVDISLAADLSDFARGATLGLPELADFLGITPGFTPEPMLKGAVTAAPAPVAGAAPPVVAPPTAGQQTVVIDKESVDAWERLGVTQAVRNNVVVIKRGGQWLRESDNALVVVEQPAAAAPGAAPERKETEITPRVISVNVDALFVRSGPATSFPLAGSQRLVRGNTFTAVAWTEGENVGGENRWWKSSFGNFVWVGGTAEKPGLTTAIEGIAPFA